MGSTGQRERQRAVRHECSDEWNANLTCMSVSCQDEIEPGEDELADDLGGVHQSDGTHITGVAFEVIHLVAAEIGVVYPR
jgi:hypothetical protein